MAARLIPPSPWGVLPTSQAWHRPPREGSQPRRGEGYRGSWAPVVASVLMCMLWLLPAGTWRAKHLGWGRPATSSPVGKKRIWFFVKKNRNGLILAP